MHPGSFHQIQNQLNDPESAAAIQSELAKLDKKKGEGDRNAEDELGAVVPPPRGSLLGSQVVDETDGGEGGVLIRSALTAQASS